MALGFVRCITLGTSPHRYSDAASHTPMASCVRDTMLQQWAQPRGRKEKLIYSCCGDELMGAFRSPFQLPLAGKCWWYGSWRGSNQWDNDEPYSSLRHAQTVPHDLKKITRPARSLVWVFLFVLVCFFLKSSTHFSNSYGTDSVHWRLRCQNLTHSNYYHSM